MSKPMDDLISRSALLNDLSYCPPELWQDEEYIKAKIIRQPAVNAMPVAHGRWECLATEHNAYRWQVDANCSCCGFVKYNVWSGFFLDMSPAIAKSAALHYASSINLPRYCESCGAKMCGERRDEGETGND